MTTPPTLAELRAAAAANPTRALLAQLAEAERRWRAYGPVEMEDV